MAVCRRHRAGCVATAGYGASDAAAVLDADQAAAGVDDDGWRGRSVDRTHVARRLCCSLVSPGVMSSSTRRRGVVRSCRGGYGAISLSMHATRDDRTTLSSLCIHRQRHPHCKNAFGTARRTVEERHEDAPPRAMTTAHSSSVAHRVKRFCRPRSPAGGATLHPCTPTRTATALILHSASDQLRARGRGPGRMRPRR